MAMKLLSALAGMAILVGVPAVAQDAAQEDGAVEITADQITGDAEAGERIFRRCQACHEVGPEAENKVGPVLTGVVGRPAAAVDGYEYSTAMQEAAAGGLVWSLENLHAFLENPREFVPGTKMVFPGLRDEQDRSDVIAYLFNASTDMEGD